MGADEDDESLLKHELNWRERPGRRRRPAGANVVLAIGIALVLPMWGLTLAAAGSAFSAGSGVVSPGALLGLVILGVELIVAIVLAQRAWIALGTRVRNALRPFGVLGPLPMLAIAVFFVLSIVYLANGGWKSLEPPPRAGRNWAMAKLPHADRYGVSYDRAVQICEKAGGRVPSQEDLGDFDPPFEGFRGASFWLQRSPSGLVVVARRCDGSRCGLRIAGLVAAHGQGKAHVVCFRP